MNHNNRLPHLHSYCRCRYCFICFIQYIRRAVSRPTINFLLDDAIIYSYSLVQSLYKKIEVCKCSGGDFGGNKSFHSFNHSFLDYLRVDSI
jgi:hypothetical protein